MKVRAKERGFYKRIREAGEVFDFPSDSFREGSWMEKVKAVGRPKKEVSDED